ncbi:MAG TPA: hypothetical protein VHZ24_10445 [Pirellulales bacterium]|jgi:hypothetical protein|nr:hypothetical protein [Pirellulales bacterium]
MKLKLKFDSTAIKAFFSRHGEKLAVGMTTIALIYLCYSAIRTPRYDKKPENLASDATNKLRAITDENNKLDARANGIIIPDPEYAVQVEGAMQAIDPTKFAMAIPWNAPLRDTRVRRDEPTYLPAENLLAAYDKGAVSSKAHKERYIGKQWIVVTALVPYGAQLTEYRRLFDDALFTDPTLDKPSYAMYAVERAEISSTKPDAPPEWKPLDAGAIFAAAEAQFAAEHPQLINKKFIDPLVTDFCPPVIGKTLGPEVAHPPEIPLLSAADIAAEKPTVSAPGAERAAADRWKRRGAEANPQPQPGNASPVQAEVVPYRLFRFFDYTVEYGKSYRYRVKLTLDNPNRGVFVRYLKSPKLAEGDTRETRWSEPSPVVSVPLDFRVLASDAKISRSASIEPQARVMVVRWVPEEGVEVAHEYLRDRGSMLDFRGTSAAIPIAGKADQTKTGSVDFVTNSLLVDVLGGDIVTDAKGRPYRAPSDTLVMNQDGSLSLHTSIGDGVQYDANRHTTGKVGAASADENAPPAGTTPGTPNSFEDFLRGAGS